MGVVLVPLVMPWGYVFNQCVKALVVVYTAPNPSAGAAAAGMVRPAINEIKNAAVSKKRAPK
jgi:hypothetical protein